MKYGAVLPAAVLAFATGGTAQAARVVEYPKNEATWKAWATEQGVQLKEALPAASKIRLSLSKSLDHEVIRAGIACSAWRIENPMTQLVEKTFADWDMLVNDGAPAADVFIDFASTISRCISTGEMKATCVTRVTLKGSVRQGSQSPVPISVAIESPTRGIGVCAGLTRGIGLVARNATFAFIEKVDQTLRPSTIQQ